MAGSSVRTRAASAFEALLPSLTADATERLGRSEGLAFIARLATSLLDIYEPLEVVYGTAELNDLVAVALEAAGERPIALRDLDRRREIDPRWYQRARQVGYVCYADRFAGSLHAVADNLDYLDELGVTYLHLMPLLEPRPGENDGGYAVRDYRAVDPRLGTMDDLSALAGRLHERGMSLCVDLVLNHTAKEHAWAEAWRAGDPAYADFYMSFPDREMPDAYERTIVPVFPDRAPGSFTKFATGEGDKWVWTTFWSYQWDLNWASPNVFRAMLETILWLANRGVDVFRLDAVPFLWKRLGTTCLNEPEVHRIVQALHALVRVAAPGVIFKAEAIVAPDDLVPYLGGHDRYRPECELAYHNQLMVMLWSSLATKDARLMAQSLARMKPIPAEATWVSYVRGHDDIGWAISAEDASAVGWDWWNHRNFLNSFFSGRFGGSYAQGALFQENPVTGDARISGSAASLCGITDDPASWPDGVRRLLLLHSVAFAYGGIPLIYMGDELAMRNDESYRDDPALADDNRWMHRPHMDWAAAERRHDPKTLEGQVFAGLRELIAARKDLLALRGGGETAVVGVDNGHVFAWRRRHPRSGTFVGLANFSEHEQTVEAAAIGHYGWLETAVSSDGPLVVREGRAHLPALGFVWLIER